MIVKRRFLKNSTVVQYLKGFFASTSTVTVPPCNLIKRISCYFTTAFSPGVKGFDGLLPTEEFTGLLRHRQITQSARGAFDPSTSFIKKHLSSLQSLNVYPNFSLPFLYIYPMFDIVLI